MSGIVQRKGIMFIFSSPSGAGKTSIVKEILKKNHLVMSVSVTTRPPRIGEIDGKDYFFINHGTFQELRSSGDLLEHAEVFGNFYGTPKKFVYNLLEEGKDVVFDIDWQGTRQITKQTAYPFVRIFILPPSLKELEKRLRNRALDDEDTLRKRLNGAFAEITHWPEYDYVLVNDVLEKSVSQVLSIIEGERLKRTNQIGLPEFVNNLKNKRK